MPSLAQSHNLYDIEDALELLLEAAEARPDDPSMSEAVGEYLQAATEKRDNIARFLTHLENQQELAKAEGRRLKDREARLSRIQSHLEDYVIRFMESRGVRKLEGKTATLSLRSCPPSVQILDPSVLPAQFLVIKQEAVPDKKAIKSAIEAGMEVPGADLQFGKQSLIRR